MKRNSQIVAVAGIVLCLVALVVIVATISWSSPRRHVVNTQSGEPQPSVNLADARKALDEKVAEIKKSGQPILLGDFRPAPIDPAKDAGPILIAAMKELDKLDSDKLWDIEFEKPLTEEQWNLVEQSLSRMQATLAMVDDGLARPEVDWQIKFISPATNILLPSLNGARQIANLLRASAAEAHHAGRDGEALRRVGQVLTLARLTDRSPFLVSHLVAVGIAGMACETIAQIEPTMTVSPAAPAATEQQVGQLIAAFLDEAWLRDGLRRTMLTERMVVLDVALAVVDRKLDLAQLLMPTSNPATRSAPSRAAVLTDARTALVYVTAVASSADADRLKEFRAKAPPRPTFQVRELRNLTTDYDRFAVSHFASIAQEHVAATALAARMWMIEHGNEALPSLTELTPKYFAAVPADPLAASPATLLYRATPEAIIYSVGRDGKDNGGAIAGKGATDIGVKLTETAR